MMFSEKRASKRVKSMLVVAKSHAVKLKDLNEGRLVVCEYFGPCVRHGSYYFGQPNPG